MKQYGVFVCQSCGTKYEQRKKSSAHFRDKKTGVATNSITIPVQLVFVEAAGKASILDFDVHFSKTKQNKL